jgi:rhomboid protease GluP
MSSDLLRRLDETPVSASLAVLYVGLALLTDPFDPTTAQLVQHGAARGIDVADGEPWRLFTYSFLHGGFVHLLFNLWALAQLGPTLERTIGWLRYSIVYALGAIGGGIVGCLWHHPLSPLVGGSGALFAMMGALVAWLLRQGGSPRGHMHLLAARQMAVMIAMNLLLGFLVPMVSNAAHLGGLATGFVVGWVVSPAPRGARLQFVLEIVAAAAVWLSMLCLCVFPVHRWDWHLLQWGRATTEEQRDAHRRAFSLAVSGDEEVSYTDARMRAFAAKVEAERRVDD